MGDDNSLSQWSGLENIETPFDRSTRNLMYVIFMIQLIALFIFCVRSWRPAALLFCLVAASMIVSIPILIWFYLKFRHETFRSGLLTEGRVEGKRFANRGGYATLKVRFEVNGISRSMWSAVSDAAYHRSSLGSRVQIRFRDKFPRLWVLWSVDS